MASTTITQLTDDLDGTPIFDEGGTVTFAYEGVTFEIDLTAANRRALEADLSRYMRVARVAVEPARPVSRRQAAAARSRIRAWARDNGYTVSDRGRLSAQVLAAFDAAHEGPSTHALRKPTVVA